MPLVINPQTGRSTRIPGVYFRMLAVASGAGPIPDFHVPVIVGDADEGHPFNADSLKQADEAAFTPFKLIGDETSVGRYFGTGSEIATAARYAKKTGLPASYYVTASPLTRASVVATSGSKAVTELLIYPYKFGAPPSYIKLKWSTSILTVTPVRRFAMLAANAASGAKRIYVRDNSWIQVGMTLTIADNDTAPASITVAGVGVEVLSSGQCRQYVDLSSALGAAFATADYGLILAYDADIVSGTLADGNAVYTYIRDTLRYQGEPLLGCTKDEDFTGASLDALGTATALRAITSSVWTNATVGTSPAGNATSHGDFLTALDAGGFTAFMVREQVRPQAFLLVSSSATIHALWRTWAGTMRADGLPVSITAGCAWGDTSTTATDDTSAVYRAQALNSQDFQLCAGGLDRLGSYLTLAPEVFGARVAGGVGHNLTNDDLVYDEVEKEWNETASGQLTALHRAGVVTYRLSRSRPFWYVVSQGLSTYQTNDTAWNTVDSKTCLVMQRDLADAINAVVTEDLDGQQLGADEVTAESIQAVVLSRFDLLHRRLRWVQGNYRMISTTLDASGNGWNVRYSCRPVVTTDFITGEGRILIGG